MTAANRSLLIADDMEYVATPPRGLNPLEFYAWRAYNRFTPEVRAAIRRGGAESDLVDAAFREYGRPMSRRDRRRAFDGLMRLHAELGGGVL